MTPEGPRDQTEAIDCTGVAGLGLRERTWERGMPQQEHRIVAPDQLRAFYWAMLGAVGVPRSDAEIVADCLLLADLRGVDSHGILHLGGYMRAILDGWINPRPSIRLVHETPTIAVMESDGGLGQIACVKAMEIAISKAKKGAFGGVAIRNSTHSGSLAYYPLMAAEAGLISYMVTSTEHAIAGGVFSYGIPAGRRDPIILDSVLSHARPSLLQTMALRGDRIPPGWALDSNGLPTEDPKEALKGFLAPIGAYKGHGLTMMGAVFAGVLSGGRRRFPRMGGIVAEPNMRQAYNMDHQNHFLFALNPGSFLPIDVYEARVAKLIDEAKACPPIPGTEVLLPGEPQARTKRQRLEDGVPVSPAVWDELSELRKQLDVEAWPE